METPNVVSCNDLFVRAVLLPHRLGSAPYESLGPRMFPGAPSHALQLPQGLLGLAHLQSHLSALEAHGGFDSKLSPALHRMAIINTRLDGDVEWGETRPGGDRGASGE